MPNNKPKKILIAPLDWGLGHTTRCIPIIGCIISLGHIPVFAGNDFQCSFIKETFGGIETIHIEGYNIRYSAWNRVGQAGIFAQLPGLMKVIQYERKWLMEVCKKHSIDGIISDNRYGLYHDTIPSVILTHQLNIQTGLGRVPNQMIQKLQYHLLNRFSSTWVVDSFDFPGLGGKLSHADILPNKTQYLGLLSRFIPEKQFSKTSNGPIVILISGPEPQRSNLSAILWKQVLAVDAKVIFIEGSDKAIVPNEIPGNITWYSHLSGTKLEEIIKSASIVISRSGYSTIMDLVALNKRAILIPTPGQTEQLYLAKQLMQSGFFYSTSQSGFNLKKAMEISKKYSPNKLNLNGLYAKHERVIEQWINSI